MSKLLHILYALPPFFFRKITIFSPIKIKNKSKNNIKRLNQFSKLSGRKKKFLLIIFCIQPNIDINLYKIDMKSLGFVIKDGYPRGISNILKIPKNSRKYYLFIYSP